MDLFSSWEYSNGFSSRWRASDYTGAAIGFQRNYNNFDLILGDVASTILPANGWSIHPEIGGVDAVCRFVSPSDATYRLDWSVARLTQYSGSSTISVLTNGILSAVATVTSNNYTYIARPTLFITAQSGDLIDFQVGAVDGPWGDTTGLHATLTVVPEPTSICGFFAGLALLRRRKRVGAG